MEKRQLMTIAYWIMIIVVVITCIFVYFYLSGNAKQCVADPIVYYQTKTQAQCFCSKLNYFVP